MNRSAVTQSLLDADPANRPEAKRQFAIQQYTYWMAVGGIVLVEWNHPILSVSEFYEWVAVTTLLWLARVGLFKVVHSKEPDELNRSVLLKMIPLVIVAIAGASWVWTVYLFQSQSLSLRELFMGIGFLNTTIAMTVMWPVTRVAVVVYNTALWGAYSLGLYINRLASPLELLALNAMVFVILWVSVKSVIVRLKKESDRSNELEGIASKLRASNAHLDALQQQAKSRLANRSQFFAEATHDFKQRLHGTKLLVLSAQAVVVDDRAKRYVERLASEIDILERNMMDILTSARRESIGTTPGIERVALQNVFQRMDLQFEELAIRHGRVILFKPTAAQGKRPANTP